MPLSAISLVAVAAAVFMGISIGSSTVASAFGPVNSSGSANVLRAALLAGLFAFLGAVTQGGNVAQTIGSGLLTGPITTVQAAAILLVGSSLVIVSVMTDFPMPTAFTVIGAVVGSSYSFNNQLVSTQLFKIIGFWVIIPLVSIAVGFGISKLLRRYIPKDESSDKKIRLLLIIAGSYVAYSAGASAVGLAVGPLTSLNVTTMELLLLGGFSILMGAWLYSPRIIKAISFDYSNVGPRRSVAALGTAALLAQIGIFFGIPISFNEAVIASMIGSGMVEGGANNVDKKKIGFTAGAWTFAFILAAVLTYAIGLLI
ncbi:MAG: anion permease [Candidatus Nanohaloarchaea archaeon]